MRIDVIASRRPRTTLAFWAILVAAALPGLVRLEFRTDGRALVPSDSPAREVDARIRARFGVGEAIVAVVSRADRGTIYEAETLRFVVGLADAFTALDIGPVRSLVSETSDHHRAGKLVEFETLLESFVAADRETPRRDNAVASAIARLRGDIEALDLYNGTLVGHDGLSTALYIEVPEGVDRQTLVGRLRDASDAGIDATSVPHRVDLLGAPVAESQLGIHLLEDLGLRSSVIGVPPVTSAPAGDWRAFIARTTGLVPLVLAVIALVFGVAFRSPWAVVIPLVEMGVALALTFGAMGWLGYPVSLTTVVMPIILVAMGVADEVHVLSRLARERHEAPDAPVGELSSATYLALTRPIVQTSLTTAFAFMSFVSSPIDPVRTFGAFTAFGVIVCMSFTLTAVPALIACHEPRIRVAQGRERWFAGLARLASSSRARIVVLAVSFIVCLLLPFGIRRIDVQDSWLGGFAARSELVRATRAYDEQYCGAHLLYLDVGIEPTEFSVEIDRRAMTRQTLRVPRTDWPNDAAADPFHAWLGANLEVRSIDHQATNGRDHWESWVESIAADGDSVVITTPRGTGSAAFILEGERFRVRLWRAPMVELPAMRAVRAFEDRLREHSEWQVGGVHGPATYAELTRFIMKARAPGSRCLPDRQRDLLYGWRNYERLRGAAARRALVSDDRRHGLITVFMRDANFRDTAALYDAIDDTERELLTPIGLSVARGGDVAVSQSLIAAIVATQVRSVLYSLALILLFTMLILRSPWLGFICVVPSAISVAVLFAAMGWLAIPLGVATSMFAAMTLGVGVDFAIHLVAAQRRRQSVARAIVEVGPAIVVDGLAVTAGFAMLMLSQVPANHRLGALAACGLIGSILAGLLLVPALLPRRAGP